MFRRPIAQSALTLLAMICMTMETAQAFDIVWDGGDGTWNDANWNGGSDPFELVGKNNGTNGYGGALQEEENFIIGTASTVTYEADVFGDMQIKQGGSLTIRDGATWEQITDDSWTANKWTQMDASELILDNGTFRRIGSTSQERGTGGAFILGSWRADDNFGVSPLQYAKIDIAITNGGRFENDGEVWFGSWEDTPPGTVVTMTIDDGSVDLTGGHVPADEEIPAWGDLVFTNRFNAELDPEEYLVKYAVNFTGPGTITVDRSGIINAYKNDDNEWTGFDPITYQELWDVGILQANGLSGADGAVFDNYFSVTGSLGSDNYTLTSKVGGLAGDYNDDQQLNDADLDLQAQVAINELPYDVKFDENGDGRVDYDDRVIWLDSHKQTWVGDSNFDTEFNTADFVLVFTEGKYETEDRAGWVQGDWNGDLKFDTADFVAAFTANGYEKGPFPSGGGVAAVPEPSAILTSLIGVLGCLGLFRRCRRQGGE